MRLTQSQLKHMKKVLRRHGGEGSGNFGHSGRPGKVGGSQPKSGSYSGDVKPGKNLGSAVARAEFDGSVSINLEQWKDLSDRTKRYVIAHEIAHQTIEDHILNNNDLWNRASEVLTIQELPDGRKLFAGGNTRIGEAISDSIAAYLVGDEIPRVKPGWKDWAQEMIVDAGYSEENLKSDIDRIFTDAEKL